jgi:hypothetical protein
MNVPALPASGSIGGIVAIQVVRYLAAAQSFAMVVFHGAWILLALATWGHASGPAGAVGDVSRALVRAYGWLGGVDADGRGGERGLMAVWAKLGLVLYVIEALWSRLFGQRKPMAWWWIVAVSWLVAQLGYVCALIPTGDLGEATLMLIVFPILAGLATAWSVAAHRLADLVESLIRKKQGGPVA